MAEVNASIPLGAKPVSVTGKISDLLQLKRQMVDIQKAEAETAGAEQTQKQRANLATFDVGKLIGDDGMIDMNKVFSSDLREAAGDTYAEQVSKYAGIRRQQLGTRQSLVELRTGQRDALNSMLGAVRSDPDVAQDTPEGRQKVAQVFQQYAEQYGEDTLPVLKAYAGALQNAPQGKLAQVLQNFQLQTTSAAALAERQAPKYVPAGGNLQQYNPLAQQGQSPDKIPITLSPGEQNKLVRGPDENPYIEQRAPTGDITAYKAASGMPRFGVGERESTTEAKVSETRKNLDQTFANRSAAARVPEQLDYIRKARELSKSVSTDNWAQKRASIESVIGSMIPGFKDAQTDASKLQELDKFLERIAANSNQILGQSASTDAARESISRQNASIGYTPQAIQAVLDYAEPQVLALQAKADAQDAWFEQEGNDVKSQHKFESEWRKAYDPRIFQLKAASDEEAKKIISKLSKDEKAELRKKTSQLKQMGAFE